MVIDMTNKLRTYIVVGLLATTGAAALGMSAVANAYPFAPEPPGMHDRARPDSPPPGIGLGREEQTELLNLLGLDEKTFNQYLNEGNSLSDIANKQKVEVEQVISLVEKQLKERARKQAEIMVDRKGMVPPPPRGK